MNEYNSAYLIYIWIFKRGILHHFEFDDIDATGNIARYKMTIAWNWCLCLVCVLFTFYEKNNLGFECLRNSIVHIAKTASFKNLLSIDNLSHALFFFLKRMQAVFSNWERTIYLSPEQITTYQTYLQCEWNRQSCKYLELYYFNSSNFCINDSLWYL